MPKLNTAVSVVDYLKSQGESSDFSSRKNIYKKSGIGRRLGSYQGSGQQNVALLNYLKKQSNTGGATEEIQNIGEATGADSPDIIGYTTGGVPLYSGGDKGRVSATKPKTTTTKSFVEGDTRTNPDTGQRERLTPIGWRPVGGQRETIFKPEERTGSTVTIPEFEDIVGRSPTVSERQELARGSYSREDIARIARGETKPKEKTISTTGEGAGEKSGTTTPSDVASNTPSLDAQEIASQASLGDIDIVDIINQIASGELTTPDVELAGEAKELAEKGVDRKTAKALTNLQKNMAKRGMTFSGMRTEAEKNLAAESLAEKSGISLKFAGELINAAAQEQDRRMKAIQAKETAANQALKSMGYIINPATGELTPTLERERFEEEPTKPADIREYEYAVNQGYEGTYEDWKREGSGGVGTVPWSQWASELGIVGTTYDQAMPIILEDVKSEKKSEQEQALAAIRGSVYQNLQPDEDGVVNLDPNDPDNVNAFIDALVGAWGDVISRQDIERYVKMEIASLEKPGTTPGVKEILKTIPGYLLDVVGNVLKGGS